MKRRLLAATALTLAFAGCGPTTTPDQSAAIAARITAIAQATLTTVNNGLAIYNVRLTGTAATVFTAAQVAVGALADAAPQGAAAVATLATDPASGAMALVTAAANFAIPILSAIPGTSEAIGQVRLALVALPLIASLAAQVLHPGTVGGVGDDARRSAARALGVRV